MLISCKCLNITEFNNSVDDQVLKRNGAVQSLLEIVPGPDEIQGLGGLAGFYYIYREFVKSVPSTLVKEAITKFEEWLLRFGSTPEWRKKAKQYARLASLCMSENYFTFRGKYFKTTSGVAMGNPLSPLLSEIFMASLEEKMEEDGLLPNKWFRYVNDILAVIPDTNIQNMLGKINTLHPKIIFTHEIEANNQLAFLDLTIKRQNGQVTFSIFRKPTSTQRTIPATSFHSYQHKMAAYGTMIHRLLTIPLTEEDYRSEKLYILDTAMKNGYPIDLE